MYTMALSRCGQPSTVLLIELTPKGVVLSFLFCSDDQLMALRIDA